MTVSSVWWVEESFPLPDLASSFYRYHGLHRILQTFLRAFGWTLGYANIIRRYLPNFKLQFLHCKCFMPSENSSIISIIHQVSFSWTTLWRCKSELQQNQTSLVLQILPVCVNVWRSPPGCCIPTSLTGRAPDAPLVWPHWQPINTQRQWVFLWWLVVYKYRASLLTTFLENGSTEVKINDAVLASLTVEPFQDNEAIFQTQNYVRTMSVNSNCIHELSGTSIEYRANL